MKKKKRRDNGYRNSSSVASVLGQDNDVCV